MISDHDLAQLQLAAYDYPNAAGIVSPFNWTWLCSGLTNLRAGFQTQPDGSQVVIFPGTGGGVDEDETLRQWALNFTAIPKMTPHPVFGWVEDGFYDEIDAFFPQLLPKLDPTKPIYCVGHSRGSPQASFVAGLLKDKGIDVTKLVLFASPAPAGGEFAAYMESIPKASYRTIGAVEPHKDLVTAVPFWPAKQLAEFTDLSVTPLPNDKWLLFCYHHMQLYAGAV